jgi:oligosaccharyltransferase complex subunit alpha (ribophorin I)
MKSQFKLGTNKVESYTRTSVFNDDTITRDDDKITYGPFTNVLALARSIVEIHYVCNAPFVTFTKVIRELEVSHHGNLAVEEHYSLLHTGAKLKGSFSRHDYQRDPNGQPSSYRYLTAHLPATAFDIYYRDIIGMSVTISKPLPPLHRFTINLFGISLYCRGDVGNVSTSHVRKGRGAMIMDIEPRYPIMGGWSADFYIGYSVPLTDFLATDATDSARFILTAPFATPFPVAAIDEIEVRVILPEGASTIQWRTPFDVDSDDYGSRQTYLDLAGRPMLVLKKSNVVRHHNIPFQVGYNYSTVLMIQEPLLVIMGFMAFFIAAMAYMRLELTITHNPGAQASRGAASEVAATATSLRSRREASQGGSWINKLLNAQNELVHAYDNRQAERPQVYALINQATSELRKVRSPHHTLT